MANLATISGNILGDSGIDSIDLIVGTGTVNYIPKFTAEGNIGNSLLVDNGSILSYNGNQVVTLNVGDSRYLMGTTNPGSVNNFTISIGNNGSYSYVQSHSSMPLELNPLGNTVRIAGNVVLHAGNYSSYALPLSGGTVSGNITANIYKVYSSGTYPSIDAVRGSYFGYSQSYPVIVLGTATVGGGSQTLAFNVDPIANPSGAFTGHGSEYMFRNVGSFITPNSANTAYNTIISWDSSGHVTSPNSFRAPIFYDSADTFYCIDPNSSSRLLNLGLGGVTPDVRLSVSGDAHVSSYLYMGGTAGSVGSWGTRILTSGGVMTVNTNGFIVNRIGYGGGTIIYSDSSERTGFATTDFSYTVSDNTPVVGSITNNRVYVSGSIQLLGNNDAIVFGRGTSTFLKDEELGFGWGGGWYAIDATYTRARNDSIVYTGSYFLAGGSMRAPIFYDSQDTNYFVDPNSTSVLAYLQLNNAESMGLYGIRGRFTNEYMHFYRKVGVGNPTGWGTGEANTPDFGLSTYGGAVFGYGNNAGMTSNGVSQFNGSIVQSTNLAYPLARWGSSGTTGAVVIKLPGGSGNYGMVHMVIDIYEYNSNNVCTVIVGGHNWNGAWYNYGANVVGYTDKPVRLGFKDGQYCVVIGNGSSSWSYGQVVLRKINNGEYYSGVMNLGGTYTVQIESDSYSWISSDLRSLRVPGNLSAEWGMYAPIYYDSDNTGYYLNPNSTSNLYQVDAFHMRMVGSSHKYFNIIPGNGYEAMVFYDGGSASPWYVGKRTSDGGGVGTADFHFYSVASGRTVVGINSSGYVYANGYHGNQNVAGTGAASYHPSGIYSTGTNWLYGTMYLNGNNVNDGNQIRANQFYATDWFRAHNRRGLYSQDYGLHFYPMDSNYWSITGSGGSVFGLAFRSNYDTGVVGYVYGETNGNFGLLNGGSWALRTYSGGGQLYGSWYINSSLTIDGWYYTTGSSGLYFNNSGNGVWSAESAGNSYGNIATYGGGRNGWSGYGILSSFTLMGRSGTDVGMHDNGGGGWIWYSAYGSGRMSVNTSTTSSSYSLYVAGNIYATGDVTAYSDRRKKTNIITIENALDTVVKMRGVFYDKLGEEDKGRQLGVIAQEVNEVLPEAVIYASDVDEYGVKYGNIVGVLIEAIKEQQKQIEELKSKLN